METTTSFDLNGAIQQWRENLAQTPAFCRENLDELESHLRDSVTTLQTRGLSPEESLLVAVKRIGKDSFLESEFRKVNSKAIWRDRALWMLIGIQFWSSVSGAVISTTRSAVAFGLISYDFSTHGRLLPATLFVFAHLFGFAASLVACWWLISRRGSRLGAWFANLMRRHRLGYLALIVLSGLLLFSFVMNYGLTMLQMKLTDLKKLSDIYSSQPYSYSIAAVVQATTFVILILLLARHRAAQSKPALDS